MQLLQPGSIKVGALSGSLQLMHFALIVNSTKQMATAGVSSDVTHDQSTQH
jgi:hypothetical protein